MPRIVLITCPDSVSGSTLARSLVGRSLAACVNLVPGVTSIYRFESEIHEDSEVLLVCKTVEGRLAAIEELLRELHPYEVPECVVLTPSHVEESYLDWLTAETRDE